MPNFRHPKAPQHLKLRHADNYNFINNSVKSSPTVEIVDRSLRDHSATSMVGAEETVGTPDPVEKGIATLSTLK